MNMKSVAVVSIFSLLMLNSYLADALKCIVCTYAEDYEGKKVGELTVPGTATLEDCWTTPDEDKYSVECHARPGEVVRCYKGYGQTDSTTEDENRRIYERSCQSYSKDDDPGDGSSWGTVYGETHHCSTDNCNSAITLHISAGFCAVLISTAFFLK